MTGLPRYFDLVRQMKNPYSYRLALVDYARAHGAQVAAARYQPQGAKGLQALSRAPHRCPHKVGGEIEKQVLALRRHLPTFSAQRLRRDFGPGVFVFN